MKIFGQLEVAQLEVLASDPALAVIGRTYFNSTTLQVRFYTGAAWQALGLPVSVVTGSRGSPVLVTAVGGITPSGVQEELIFIAGNAAPITITANPQIAAGTVVGQDLELLSRDATNTVLLSDGNGVDLNGPWLGALESVIGLRWDGSNWTERYRR